MLKRFSLYIGNFLEFYDFTLFAYLIPIISPVLFPDASLIVSYTTGYLFLAVGFLFRPMGAILFGHIGDKYGRKLALQISILMMAISTGAMGLLSRNILDYDSLLALVIVFRIMQGLSAGGEYSGAGLMLIEKAEKRKQFSLGAYLTSSALLGAFAASLAAASTTWFSENDYYWRFLFFFGGGVGFIVFFLRFFLTEDCNLLEEKKDAYIAWTRLFKEYYVSIIFVILCSGLMNVPFQMVTGFINTYFIASGDYTKEVLMIVNAFVVLFCAIVTAIFGHISQFVNPQKMMLRASLGIIIFAVPFFLLVKQENIYVFVFAELILILLSQIFVAPAFAVLANLFPKKVRYRGLAVGNCLGIAFIGGVTPYFSSILINETGLEWSPALYLLVVAINAFIATILLKKRGERVDEK
jgi:MHS family proline/betaine transporter-like MFS transporter